MAFIKDGYIRVVDIPAVSKKVPPNPLLGYDGHRTASPSLAGSSSSVTQSTLAHRVLLKDQRCLITSAISNQIQACHLINAIRMKASNRAAKLPLKEEVERILTRQQFGVEDFFLDSLPNCIAMEAQWHGDLDTYGSFCITIPQQQIYQVTVALGISNQEWDNRAKSDPKALRNINLTVDPFVVRKCTLLVLRPDLFLPDNRPLPINTAGALRDPGGSHPSKSERSSWISYHSQSNLAFLVDSSNGWFETFDFKSLREQKDSLSIFAPLVNANSKLQSRISDNLHVRQYAQLVGDAVTAIFHVPKEVRDQTPSLIPPVPALPPAHHPNIVPAVPSFELGRNKDLGQDSMDGGVEGHSNLANNVQEYGFEEDDEDDEDEEDDEPDTINGLTFPEMKTILQQVSDGTISDRERAEAAMLMLGMAGGHRHSQALSPLITD